MRSTIEAHNLVKRYGAFEAVRGVSFTVQSGEIVGLLGPNGAGKTTIMKVLTCYHFPSNGTVRVNSHPVTEEPLAVKRSIGYLPENAPVYSDLKVIEYLKFIARIRGLSVEDARARIEWSIEECGLEPVVYRSIGKLSKGFRQRVGLAQAILHDPPTLILDEPTSGLDPGQIIEIRELIKDLGSRKTVILSTHILQEVESICNEVLILNNGLIVGRGTLEQLTGSMKRRTVVAVAVEGRPAHEVEEELKLSGLGDVTMHPLAIDRNRVEFDLTLSSSVTEGAVFDWAVSRGLKIVSLANKSSGLEEVFLKLTRAENENA